MIYIIIFNEQCRPLVIVQLVYPSTIAILKIDPEI